MNQILIKPLITEKSMRDATAGRFTFAVAASVNKAEIAKAIVASFPVKVVDVETNIIKGKTKRSGRMRQETKTSAWKKAVVELEKGQKIDLFDVTEGQSPKSS